MYYYYYTLFILIGLFCLAECEDCKRPADVLKYEESCLDDVSGIIEKVERYATNAFASAKKFFGLNSDEKPEEPKKCEYYTCILSRLNLLDANNVTDRMKMQEWTLQQVEEGKRSNFNNTINECFNGLLKSVVDGTPFDSTPIISYKLSSTEMNETSYEQNPCEINKNMVKCFSKESNNCPTFKI